MIIKSSQRASPRQLAYHLINDDENEIITLSDQRGLLSKNVMDALDDMELISQASRCEKHLYHISINPSQEIQEDQWQIAWELYETEFSLEDLPYIEVTHVKPDGRRHKHRVYSRIDIDTGNAVTLSFTKVRNEKVSRILEYYFEHPLTPGKHNRSVITYLKKEGFTEVAQRLEAENAPNKDRPVASANPREHQQQKRTKISIEEVKHELQTAYKQSDTGHAFEIAIAPKGYLMARGDKRDIVIIDEAGGLHSPRRRLDVKAQDLRTKWQDLILEHLPTVEQVKQAQDSHRQIQKVRKENPPDEALKKLHEQRQQVDREIRELEQQLDLERQSPSETAQKTASKDHLSKSSQKPSSPEEVQQRSSQDSPSEQPNERHLIETFLNFTLEPERGRRSSRGDTQQKNAQFQTAQTVSKTVLSLTGKEAIQERERRITSAEKAQDKQPSAISRYLTGLGAMMKEKGQGVYRTADRFLAERLARYGHAPATIRRVLFRASPELMNQDPSARRSYVWRLVDRIYSRTKLQNTTIEKRKVEARKPMAKDEKKSTERAPKSELQQPSSQPEKPFDPIRDDPGIESADFDLLFPSGIARRTAVNAGQKAWKNRKLLWEEAKELWQERHKILEEGSERLKGFLKNSNEQPEQFQQSEKLSPKLAEEKEPGQHALERLEPEQQPPEREARQQSPPREEKPLIEPEIRQQSSSHQRQSQESKTEKFHQVTKEVLADQVRQTLQPSDSEQKTEVSTQQSSSPSLSNRPLRVDEAISIQAEYPRKDGLQSQLQDAKSQELQTNTEEVLLSHKDYLETQFPWLRNEESARRFQDIIQNGQDLQEKEWAVLDSKERYQKLFMSEEFQKQFKGEDYASREADKFIMKGMIYQTLEQGDLSSKTDEEIGYDLVKDHVALAENSPNAARMDDQLGYSGKVFQEAWNDLMAQKQKEMPARSFSHTQDVPDLSKRYDAYKQQLEVYQTQTQQMSQDFGYGY